MHEQKDNYINALQVAAAETEAYYRRSIAKTEQQKMLEQLLTDRSLSCSSIADISCGGGTLSYHLMALYPDARFLLSDLNPEALRIARDLNPGSQFTFASENIYDMQGLATDTFDLVCCWQTLSWLDQPERALDELIRITKPGGRIFASSLFNLNHDVDIYAQVTDHTRPNGELELPYAYNTYSARTTRKWLDGKVTNYELHPFVPNIDFTYEGRGIGTYTVQTLTERLQISGGYLMNWAILEIVK